MSCSTPSMPFSERTPQDQTWLTATCLAGLPSIWTLRVALQRHGFAGGKTGGLHKRCRPVGYDRFIYAFPDIGCSWSGMGTWVAQPSSAWFNGYLDGSQLREPRTRSQLWASPLPSVLQWASPHSVNAVTWQSMAMCWTRWAVSGGHFNSFPEGATGVAETTGYPPSSDR